MFQKTNSTTYPHRLINVLRTPSLLLTLLWVMLILPLSPIIGQAPSSVLPDITHFKIDFPVDKNGKDYNGVKYDDRDAPLIKAATQKNLDGYVPSGTFKKYFYVSGKEVVFKAHCAGALTSANSYPRCELRQLVNGGDSFWKYGDEHEFNATFRIMNLPNKKKEVCILQLKGNDSKSTSGTEEAFRLDYRAGSQGFHIEQNEGKGPENIIPYALGQTIRARIYINKSRIYIELENTSTGHEWSYDYKSNYPYGYFKAGCYTQSSVWKEKNGVGNEDPDAYGEVRFSKLTVGKSDNNDDDSTPPTSSCSPKVPANRAATNVSTNSVKLNWKYDKNMDHYNVRYRKKGTSSWKSKTSIKAGNVTISGLSDDTTYEWQVRAKCKDGSATQYSSGQGANFTTNDNNDDSSNDNISGNLARSGKASQSSTSNNGAASRAIDGNTNGKWSKNSVTHTKSESKPWWQVKLNKNSNIQQIVVYNRTDNCCISRLSNFTVSILNDKGKVVWSNRYSNPPSQRLTINLNKTGRTIKVNLNGTGVLSLAEVQVFGSNNNDNNDDSDNNDNDTVDPPPTAGNNDVFVIRKKNSAGYALDGGNRGSNNQNIYLWPYNPSNVNQQWIEIDRGNGFYSYQKKNTNYCIDGGSGGGKGQNVRLWTCNDNNEDQQWEKVKVSGNTYRLEKRNADNYCIDGQGEGANRQNVHLWRNKDSNKNQQWIFEKVGSTDAQ